MVRSFRRYLVLRIYVLQAGMATVALMVALWTADLFSRDGWRPCCADRGDRVNGVRAVHLPARTRRPALARHRRPRGSVRRGGAFCLLCRRHRRRVDHENISLLFGFYAALAVGLAMLAMAVTNTEHPPAAGTALAVVGYGLHWELAVFTLTAVLVLIEVHRVLRDRMRDLD